MVNKNEIELTYRPRDCAKECGYFYSDINVCTYSSKPKRVSFNKKLGYYCKDKCPLDKEEHYE